MTKNTNSKRYLLSHKNNVCACVIYFDAVLVDLQIILDASSYFAQNTSHTSLEMCRVFKKTKNCR